VAHNVYTCAAACPDAAEGDLVAAVAGDCRDAASPPRRGEAFRCLAALAVARRPGAAQALDELVWPALRSARAQLEAQSAEAAAKKGAKARAKRDDFAALVAALLGAAAAAAPASSLLREAEGVLREAAAGNDASVAAQALGALSAAATRGGPAGAAALGASLAAYARPTTGMALGSSHDSSNVSQLIVVRRPRVTTRKNDK